MSGVYSSRPAPGFSSVTQIDGWVLLNAVTARAMPGTQAQKVIFVALELQDAPPASTLAAGLAEALAVPPVLLVPLLPQAASSASAATPASPAVSRATARADDRDRLIGDGPPESHVDPDFGNIGVYSLGSACSDLPRWPRPRGDSRALWRRASTGWSLPPR